MSKKEIVVVVMSDCHSLDGGAMDEFSVTNYYSRANSGMLLEVTVWALTDLDVVKERAGWRVAISVTLERHVVSFYDGPLGQDLEANLLRWI